jgi:glycosyltransferase involved in cell wall biosynthesis
VRLKANAPLTVALDARMPVDRWGGVQQVAQGLASGFATLDADVDLWFIGYPDAAEWLGPHLGGRAGLRLVDATFGRTRARRAFDAVRRRSPALARAAASASAGLDISRIRLPRSNGFLESLGLDLVHFLVPQAVLTKVPSIYQPHDLQHVHLSELFEPLQVRYRDMAYRTFAEQAAIVSVMTVWGREDLVRSFGLRRSKVAVVPWAPVAGLRTSAKDVAFEVKVPERFVLYPAQTWPHKNHSRLLEALALLRGRGVRVDLVSIGRLNEHYPRIRAQVDRLGLADQVKFLGYVDEAVVEALYRRATALVFPSLFEGWGLPVVEAFNYGVPVAVAAATVLPEVAGDAAVLFDPLNPESMADAVQRVWLDETLRDDLRARGYRRVAGFSWAHTAATFLALYKRVGNRPLDEQEIRLLEPPTLVR